MWYNIARFEEALAVNYGLDNEEREALRQLGNHILSPHPLLLVKNKYFVMLPSIIEAEKSLNFSLKA